MKELSSDIRRSSMAETMPTTLPQTTRHFSSIAEFMPYSSTTKKIPLNAYISDLPEALQKEQYEKIYIQIYNDTRRASKFLQKQSETIEKKVVKKNISRILQHTQDERDFNDRFAINPRMKSKTARSLKKNMHIGLTGLEKDGQTRKYFFTNYKKVINLEEECMLLQYFLKDEEKDDMSKTPVKYLRNVPETSRHRRMTPSSRQTARLYKTHDQRQYKSLKKRVHLKEQFVEKCSMIAKKNPTYRRKQNFKEIEYILHENNKNIMEQTIINEYDDKEKIALERNNKLIRLYLNFALVSQNLRVYYNYISEEGIKKFKQKLFEVSSILQAKEFAVDAQIAKIVEYKSKKVLQFEDFKELIYGVNDILKGDIVSIFQEKYPSYFHRQCEEAIKTHAAQIEKWMHHHKTKFLLQMVFNTQPDKIIGKKILPIKYIPDFFKAYGLSEKDLSISRIYYNYQWCQHHSAGISFEEFCDATILLGMKGNDWKGIQSLLKKINIRKLV